MKTIEQKILLGRSTFATLVSEYISPTEVSRLLITLDDGKVLVWTYVGCDFSMDNATYLYKQGLLRLSKRLKRRISYVFIVPVLPESEDIPAHYVNRVPLEFS